VNPGKVAAASAGNPANRVNREATGARDPNGKADAKAHATTSAVKAARVAATGADPGPAGAAEAADATSRAAVRTS
jgi:hypothetical protein